MAEKIKGENINSYEEFNDLTDKNIIEFNFNGTAEVIKLEKLDHIINKIKSQDALPELYALISHLNNDSNKISDAIKYEIVKLLKEILPKETEVKVEIGFKQGSVEIIGMVVVLISQIVDVVSFIDLLKNGIKLIVEKITTSTIEANSEFKVQEISVNIEKEKVKKPDVNFLTRILWWCAGASSQSLGEISKTDSVEKYKYQCVGVAVIFTAILAFLSSYFAFYTVFAPRDLKTIDNRTVVLAAFLALIWSIIIFNLDRYIVIAIKKYVIEDENLTTRITNFGNELLSTLPRVILAIGIALVISKPLELKIFESEIITRIESDIINKVDERKKILDEKYKPEIAYKRDEIAQIEAKLKSKEEKRDTLQKEYLAETDGSGGTRKVGWGSVAKAKEKEKILIEKEIENYKKNEKEKDDNSANSINNDIKKIEENKITELESFKNTFSKGFLERIKTIEKLAFEEPAIYKASWGITLLIIFLELAPVLVKLFLPPSEYDADLDLRSSTLTNKFLSAKETNIKSIKDKYNNIFLTDSDMNKSFFEESKTFGNNFIRQVFGGFNLNEETNSLQNLYKFIKKKIFFNK